VTADDCPHQGVRVRADSVPEAGQCFGAVERDAVGDARQQVHHQVVGVRVDRETVDDPADDVSA